MKIIELNDEKAQALASELQGNIHAETTSSASVIAGTHSALGHITIVMMPFGPCLVIPSRPDDLPDRVPS